MSNPLEILGIKNQTNKDDAFAQSLFYFMREFHFNPLDGGYKLEITWKKWFWKIKIPYIRIIKKGISIPLFNALMEQMNKHYKKENEQMKKANRRR